MVGFASEQALRRDIMTMMLELAEGLQSLDNSESEHKREIQRSEAIAERSCCISDLFHRSAEKTRGTDSEVIYLLEARRFREKAEMEKQFIARRIRSCARIAELKTRYDILLQDLFTREIGSKEENN